MTFAKFKPFALAFAALTSGLAALAPLPAHAEDTVAIEIVVKDHVFVPAEVKLPKGKVVMLTVKNNDDTPMEFESKPLKIEKPIKGNSSAIVRIKVPDAADKILFVDEPREDKTLGYFVVE